ncbi:hypothetical protein ACHAPJ_008957 [Fusarium lateritium]
MSAQQSNLYSQAFNFSNLAEHKVDPRTGQYACAIHLYQAPAEVRNTPHFDLSLQFDSLNPEDAGFGKGWSLNLSRYKHRRSKTLSLVTGEHYQVIETDSTLAVKDQKLKSFLFERSGDDYRVIHKSGVIEILSNAGNTFNVTVPVKLYAANGRSLDLEWTNFGETPRLSYVKEGDSGEVLLKIDYSGFQVDVIMSLDAAKRRTTRLIKGGEDLLTEVSTPFDSGSAALSSWKFKYEHGGSFLLIRQLTSPAGLVEQLFYQHDGHRLPDGAPVTAIPYVLSQAVYPGQNQPKITTSYAYSALNFLGYGGVNSWDSHGDSLFNARAKYQYTSTAKVHGGATSTYTYNKFHLMVSVHRQQGTKSITQRTTYHAVEDESFENQPAQYQLPKEVEITYADSAIEGSFRTEKTLYSFDVWGNPTETVEKNGTKTIREYYLEEGESGSCPADPSGFRRHLKRESRAPPGDGLARSKEFRYTQLPTTGNVDATRHFVVVSQEASFEHRQMLLRTEYSHVNQAGSRDHGSIKKQVSWIGEQLEMTMDKKRVYLDSTICKETVQTTSFDGHIVNVEASTCLSTGRILCQKDQYGIETVFQYDSLGRLLEETVAPATEYEASRKSEYLVDENGIGYGVTKTNGKGVQTRYTTDGMERVVRVEKQDVAHQDASTAAAVTFRVTQESFYNAAGQCVQADAMDWLSLDHESTPKKILAVRHIEYDDWGTMCRSVDAAGVVNLAIKDPISMTQTTGIKGKGTMETKLNISGKPIEALMRKSDGTIHGKTCYLYDGWDRLIEQRDSLERITKYTYDSFDRVVETLGPDGSISRTGYASHITGALPTRMEVGKETLGQQEYDGLARSTSKTAGKRTSVAVYDSNGPHPTQITMANGKQHTFSYEPALSHALVNANSEDGEVAFEHDKKTAAITRLQNKTSIIDRTYLPSGFLARETIKFSDGRNLSAASTYSMAGLPLSHVDVHGHKREIEYDSHGRTTQLAQGTVKVGFKYNLENLVSETSIRNDDEGQGHGLQIQVVYDDFGNEIERCIRHEDNGSVMYRIRRTFNSVSMISRCLVEDAQSHVLRNERFTYDIRDRLVDYECQGSQPPQDENGWRVRKQSFTFDSLNNLIEIYTISYDGIEYTKRYLYDPENPTKLDSIANTSKDLSSTINLLYDDNGCLIHDEEQRALKYDTHKRLSAVYGHDGQVICRYHYDALGQLIRQEVPGKPDTELHYHDGTLIATTQGSSKTSYVTDGHVYWGECVQEDGQKSQIQFWAPDSNQSVLATVKGGGGKVQHHEYTPYGFSGGSSPSIGFNGQWRDPITGWYHLGNGYRVYSPVLMRFHTPDSWSPFISREINPYTYCRGDPINNSDPSGHMTVTREWAVFGVGLGVSILAGILTAGTSFAVELGVSVAVGAASDAITGAVYDSITGSPSQNPWNTKTITAAGANDPSTTEDGFASDLVLGAIGALIGTVLVMGMAKGLKGLARGVMNREITPGIDFVRGEKLGVRSMSVRDIGYTQDTIGPSMRARSTGRISVAKQIKGMKGKSLDEIRTIIGGFGPLEVVRTEMTENGVTIYRYLAVHNRRLTIFKQALQGFEQDRIPVRVLATEDEWASHSFKRTTKDFGESVLVTSGEDTSSLASYLSSYL